MTREQAEKYNTNTNTNTNQGAMTMPDVSILNHMAAVGQDTPTDLRRGPTRTKYEIMVALLWILRCEQSGEYEDEEKGEAIRKADLSKLRSLQNILSYETGCEYYGVN